MNAKTQPHVCHASRAGALDTGLRKLIHNPEKILSPYIRPGMRVLESGCGPGFFTMEIARLAGKDGGVIAADLQSEMLEHVSQKALLCDKPCKVRLHLCGSDKIGLPENERIDFAFIFYMLHEVPDQRNFINEISQHLENKGELMIVEPRFHVTRDNFRASVDTVKSCGFEITEHPQVLFSRAVIARKLSDPTR